jgi:hypothetical protein
MDLSDKIKAIQQHTGVEADGIATSKTWIAIYHLLFANVPYDLNVDSIIKAVQQQVVVRVDGHATPKTWDILYQYVMENKIGQQDNCIDSHNEIILQSMAKEVVPFAKELILLAAAEGINIRLMCNETTAINNQHSVSKKIANNLQGDNFDYDFGLVFDVGIYEKGEDGELIYQQSSPLYAVVAKLGESIGLTWTGNNKTFTSTSNFELRPAWAVRMKEMEMLDELCRRKREKINLLAIL